MKFKFFFISLLALATSSSGFAQTLPDPCKMLGDLQEIGKQIVAKPATGRQVRPMDLSEDTLAKGLELSVDRRMKIMCEIKQAVKEKYSLIDLKQERLGIDVEQILQGCARDELSIASNDRQDFLDRAQLCVAKIQDTHFGGYARSKRPTVVTAILATNIGDKVYITQNSPLLIAKIKAVDPDGTLQEMENILAPGNEILKIDGKPAIDAVRELLPYMNSSSPAFALSYAARTFFARSLKYPTKRTVSLDIQTAAGVKHIALPWMAQVTAGNFDAQVKFKKIGFPLVNDLQWRYDPVLRKFEKNEEALWTVGYTPTDPLFKDKATFVSYNDDSGRNGLRVGEVVIDRDHVFCYMQLQTFYSEKFTREGTKDGVPFFEPIEKFVASCEAKRLPLILDLKRNGGGNGDYPAKLLSILSPKGATYGGALAAFRITPSMIDLLTQEVDPSASGARTFDNGMDLQTILDAFTDALNTHAPYTDILYWNDVTPNAKVGGYSQKIVAIVTPFCISACDMTSALLKNSGRAVLLGTGANGTGAGFWSSKTLDPEFQDSEGQLKFEIPNFLFGIQTKAGEAQRLPYGAYKNLLMENLPTPTDVLRDLDPKDLSTGGKYLGEAAVTELFR